MEIDAIAPPSALPLTKLSADYGLTSYPGTVFSHALCGADQAANSSAGRDKDLLS